ncbi:transposase, MuDR [Tanacetum coccineum]|uniref:Transposase, MuDR n=1 Tax=Tanacetum coccineum TaxID=301880 RepID=A0ABQ5H983_9ASTR
MVIVNWKLRPKENDPNMFTLKVNHGGVFTYVYGLKRTRAPRRVYKGGNADWFDDVDADGFSVLEVSGMVKELGYENPEMKFYYKKPTVELDTSLEPLRKDIDVLDMLSYVSKYKLMKVFIEHHVDNSLLDTIDLDQEDDSAGLGVAYENVEEFDPLFSYQHMQTGDLNEGVNHTEGDDNNEGVDQTKVSDNNEGVDHTEVSDNNEGVDHTEVSDNNEGDGQTESSDDNEKSDDSDFECDLEDRIDDVHVEMQMFKDNIDPNVEWDFDSEIDSDDEEAERKKALRMLRKSLKPVDGKTNTENFYASQTFPTKGMIKDMVTRVGPNEDGLGVGPSGGDDLSGGDGLSGSKSKKVFRAKQMAEYKVHGDHISQYTQLRQYVLELKERNPDTIVKIDVERDYEPESMIRQFRRIYVCLGALKSGFKAGQIDLLGLDRCFMSGPFPMQTLTAVDDLELFKNSNITFVTDRQKGLIPALAETFPSAEHRYCLKHIYDNMKLQWRGQQFKDLLWRCATATTVSYFNKNIEELKGNQCMVNMEERTCSCRKWDLTGMPCKHAVGAIWNMTENELEPGVVNQLPATNVVKKVTSRTCKGQRGTTSSAPAVNPSAPAFNPSQTTQTTVNPSAPPVNPSQTSPTIRYIKANASRFSPANNTTSRTSGATGPSGSGKRQVGE